MRSAQDYLSCFVRVVNTGRISCAVFFKRHFGDAKGGSQIVNKMFNNRLTKKNNFCSCLSVLIRTVLPQSKKLGVFTPWCEHLLFLRVVPMSAVGTYGKL
jgi:hypothetical protein